MNINEIVRRKVTMLFTKHNITWSLFDYKFIQMLNSAMHHWSSVELGLLAKQLSY